MLFGNMAVSQFCHFGRFVARFSMEFIIMRFNLFCQSLQTDLLDRIEEGVCALFSKSVVKDSRLNTLLYIFSSVYICRFGFPLRLLLLKKRKQIELFSVCERKNNRMNTVKERTLCFMNEVGVPVSALAKNVGLSASTLYKWKLGLIKISPSALKRIDDYLRRLNY